MAISNSKGNFIFRKITALRPVRPPWAISENEFINTCTRCGECVKQCPVNVIRVADGSFPEINFSSSGCDFCEVCAAVCLPGALLIGQSAPFNSIAVIGNECFSERGVICHSCGEACEIQAIHFQQVVGGVTHVLMNTDNCNGCGECVSICPANAITIQHRL
ncbi:MAG: ferredoxin-type protein NapF [Gammaproteobacteria bacterium]|nr:ferredoxin-type protein NapF [Gammaproteobacteria bacterium]